MNYINCQNDISPSLMRKTITFWCENSLQHIGSLLSAFRGSGAVLNEEFLRELKEIELIFKSVFDEYSSSKTNLPTRPAILFKTNTRFIALLERIKLESVSGYPILQQSVYHYIFEQNYINAIFGVMVPLQTPLITVKFAPFYNNNCIFNQMYFWSVIGSMHPSLLLNNSDFAAALNGYSKEFLRDIVNGFNGIGFMLSSLQKTTNKNKLLKIFENFQQLNSNFLSFLESALAGSARVYTSVSPQRFSDAFYKSVRHMIAEHKLVNELNQSIAKILN